MNRGDPRCWKQWIVSCSRVNEHSAHLTHFNITFNNAACIYFIKLQALWYDNHTKSYCDYGCISMNHAALILYLLKSYDLTTPNLSSYSLKLLPSVATYISDFFWSWGMWYQWDLIVSYQLMTKSQSVPHTECHVTPADIKYSECIIWTIFMILLWCLFCHSDLHPLYCMEKIRNYVL